MRKQVINILLVIVGSFVYALAINSIIIPNHLGEGGVTGLTVIFYYLFKFSPAYSNLVINAFILLIGWKLLDRLTIYYTVLSVFLLSIFLRFLDLPAFIPDNSLLAPILTGILIGLGLGLVILGHGTTAGTDILALIFKKYFGIPVSTTILLFDVLVVGILFTIIGLENGLLTLCAIVITSYILNFILEGFNPRKQLIIISKQSDQIGQEIIAKLGRGLTVFRGYGFYTKEAKDILYLAVNRLQLMAVQRIIYGIDPDAFVTISSVQQVYGEGFTIPLETKKDYT